MVLLPQQSQQASRHILAKCPQNSAWLQLCKETWMQVTVWGKFSSVKTPVLKSCVGQPSTSTGPSPRTMKSIPPMQWWSPGLMLPPVNLIAEETAVTRRWASHGSSSHLWWNWSFTFSLMIYHTEEHLPAGCCIPGNCLLCYCPVCKGWDTVFLHACRRQQCGHARWLQ